MADQDQDKSEQATPFKLEEAKRRGQVAKSLDFNSFLLLAGMLGVLYGWGQRSIENGLRLERAIFSQAQEFAYDAPAILPWLAVIIMEVGKLLAPVFLVAVVIGVLSNLFQTGPVFSFFPLKPDPQRLNPVQARVCVDFVRSSRVPGVQVVAGHHAGGAARYAVHALGFRQEDAHEPARDEGRSKTPRRRSADTPKNPPAATRSGQAQQVAR
jgi:hypothetical protein